MDPDSDGPKTYGSYRSGSAKLPQRKTRAKINCFLDAADALLALLPLLLRLLLDELLAPAPRLLLFLLLASPLLLLVGSRVPIFQCCGSGSGIRCLFTPGSGLLKSQDPDPGSGMNNPDHIS
jgi:hypothetical protein